MNLGVLQDMKGGDIHVRIGGITDHNGKHAYSTPCVISVLYFEVEYFDFGDLRLHGANVLGFLMEFWGQR